MLTCATPESSCGSCNRFIQVRFLLRCQSAASQPVALLIYQAVFFFRVLQDVHLRAYSDSPGRDIFTGLRCHMITP